jgi:hypothetical protein
VIIALCILVPLYYPQFGILIIVALIGGIYVLDGIGALYQPLKPEFHAFQKFARAIGILEKSKEDIAYEEAFRCLNKAHQTLKSVELNELGWYDWSNEVYKQFLDNLKLIILPAVVEGPIKIEHLEDIALALYVTDPIILNTINDKVESEPTYKKRVARERKIVSFVKKFRESTYGRILGSLVLGYGLVLLISLIYVIGTQQDFMVFARENPEIIVLGGLATSGIVGWKIK